MTYHVAHFWKTKVNFLYHINHVCLPCNHYLYRLMGQMHIIYIFSFSWRDGVGICLRAMSYLEGRPSCCSFKLYRSVCSFHTSCNVVSRFIYLLFHSLPKKNMPKKSERKKENCVLHAKHCPMCCEKQEKKNKIAYKTCGLVVNDNLVKRSLHRYGANGVLIIIYIYIYT